MSLFRWSQQAPPIPAPGARPKTGSVFVTNETALRHSAVWACLRLRADLISTFPVDAFRIVDGVQVEVPKPPILVNPGGERVGIQEWIYSTQVDLDRAGNCFGVITERNALGLPARIDLVQLGEVSVRPAAPNDPFDDSLVYTIGGKRYAERDVWHERQYTIAGLAVGLSPVAFAAWSIGSYLSAQDFGLSWFGNSAIPAAELKNTAKTLTPKEATTAVMNYEASVKSGSVWAHGNDWELRPMQAVASQTQFLESMNHTIPDIARFFGVPSDLIDSGPSGSGASINYANINQRNLQLLIMNLGPPVMRRETAMSSWLSRPRFVKLNTDSLLRMDPETRARTLQIRIESRQLAPSEARRHENLAPFTPDQLGEFDRLFGSPRTTPTEATA